MLLNYLKQLFALGSVIMVNIYLDFVLLNIYQYCNSHSVFGEKLLNITWLESVCLPTYYLHVPLSDLKLGKGLEIEIK